MGGKTTQGWSSLSPSPTARNNCHQIHLTQVSAKLYGSCFSFLKPIKCFGGEAPRCSSPLPGRSQAHLRRSFPGNPTVKAGPRTGHSTTSSWSSLHWVMNCERYACGRRGEMTLRPCPRLEHLGTDPTPLCQTDTTMPQLIA